MSDQHDDPGLTEDPRDPDTGGDPDDLPAGEPDDNPDDLTVQGGE